MILKCTRCGKILVSIKELRQHSINHDEYNMIKGAEELSKKLDKRFKKEDDII